MTLNGRSPDSRVIAFGMSSQTIKSPVTVYRLPQAIRLQLRGQSWHWSIHFHEPSAPHSLFITIAGEPLLKRLHICKTICQYIKIVLNNCMIFSVFIYYPPTLPSVPPRVAGMA